MKCVLIIGDDKLGHQAISSLHREIPIYLNQSNSPKRVITLLQKKILDPRDLVRMVWAELQRKKTAIPALPILRSNDDVVKMINQEKPDRIICFRAGLIIKKDTLSQTPYFLNLHYADLPKWGGLGSIARAMRAKAYVQNACLHEMEAKIDAGKVLKREAYILDPQMSYKDNEDLAFAAGLTLLKRIIKRNEL